MRTPLILLLVLTGCAGRDKDSGATDSNNPDPSATNDGPSANAGPDQSVSGDAVVNLSGALSADPDGDPLTFYWSFEAIPAGSTVDTKASPFSANHSTAAVTTSFTPDMLGTYVIELYVRDDHGHQSGSDFVIITTEEPETRPVANAGADVVVDAGDAASVNGTGSYDPQGRSLTYSWTIVDKPSGSSASLSDATAVSPSLQTDLKGAYTATLIVNNGLTSSAGDSVTVTATAEDGAPVASAGPDQNNAEDCSHIELDCSASSDPDGDALTYFWEVQRKPTGSNVGNSSFNPDRYDMDPTFYPDIAGTYILSCAVSDGVNWSTPDTMTIVAAERESNVPPTVNAGADKTVDAGSAECEPSGYTYNCDECADQVIALGDDAVATDANGDPLTYAWAIEDGDAELAATDVLSTQVTLTDIEPDEAGVCIELTYKFRLSVTDCTGATTSDTVKFEATCCGVEDTSQ